MKERPSFSLMALFSYANFRSNERMISGARYMEAPGQWICKLGSLPRILRVHSKRQALEQLDYYEKYGFLTYEWLDKENEIIRFSITNWKEHCTSLQYNYYSYKGSGFFSSHYLLVECSYESLSKQMGSYLVNWTPLWTCGCTPS